MRQDITHTERERERERERESESAIRSAIRIVHIPFTRKDKIKLLLVWDMWTKIAKLVWEQFNDDRFVCNHLF